VRRGSRRWGPAHIAVLAGVLVAGALPASGPAGDAFSDAAGDALGTAITEPETAVDIAAAGSTNATFRIRVDAVAYYLPGRTASGLPVGKGVVAVDPKLIPLGTRLFVPGYGRGVAADVGTAIKGRIIDLWMPNTAAARKWGRKTVTITIFR
jgi:3D (Asp-Asp-Asp) domain-containing protein